MLWNGCCGCGYKIKEYMCSKTCLASVRSNTKLLMIAFGILNSKSSEPRRLCVCISSH